MNSQLKEIIHKIISDFHDFKILSFKKAQEYYDGLDEDEYEHLYVGLIMNINSDVDLLILVTVFDSQFCMQVSIFCRGYSDYQDGETYDFLQDEDDMQVMFTAYSYEDDLILYTSPFYYQYSEYEEMITQIGYAENFAYKMASEVTWI